MYFLITTMREKGVARPWKDIRHMKPIRGDVKICNELCQALNRTSDVASVRGDMPLDPPVLSPLLDANVSGMATNAFTLRSRWLLVCAVVVV